jgi:hypothetical protein
VLDICTLGDAADVNPVIKFLRHALQHVGVNRGQIYVSKILCAFSWIKKKKLTASMHGIESFEKKLRKTKNAQKNIFFFCSQQENKNNIADP